MNRIRLLRASHGARVFLLHSPLFALCVYTTPLSHFIELNYGTLCFPPPPLTSNWLQQIAAPPLSAKRLLFLKIGDFKKSQCEPGAFKYKQYTRPERRGHWITVTARLAKPITLCRVLHSDFLSTS